MARHEHDRTQPAERRPVPGRDGDHADRGADDGQGHRGDLEVTGVARGHDGQQGRRALECDPGGGTTSQGSGQDADQTGVRRQHQGACLGVGLHHQTPGDQRPTADERAQRSRQSGGDLGVGRQLPERPGRDQPQEQPGGDEGRQQVVGRCGVQRDQGQVRRGAAADDSSEDRVARPPGSTGGDRGRETRGQDSRPQRGLELEHQHESAEGDHCRRERADQLGRVPARRDGDMTQQARCGSDHGERDHDGHPGGCVAQRRQGRVHGHRLARAQRQQCGPGADDKKDPRQEHPEPGERGSPLCPGTRRERGDQPEDHQGGARREQVPRARADRGRPVGQQHQRHEGGAGRDGPGFVADSGEVHHDRGEQRSDQERPPAEVGPPVAETNRLQRAVPAQPEQHQPGEAGQPAQAVRRPGHQPAQQHERTGQQGNGDRGSDRGVLGRPCVRRAEHQPADHGDHLHAVQLAEALASGPHADADAHGQQGAADQCSGPAHRQGIQAGEPCRLRGQEVDGEHAGHHQPERLGGSAQARPGQQHGDRCEHAGEPQQHQGSAGQPQQAPRDGDEDDRRHQQAEAPEGEQHHRHGGRRQLEPLPGLRQTLGLADGMARVQGFREAGCLGGRVRGRCRCRGWGSWQCWGCCRRRRQAQPLDEPVGRHHGVPQLRCQGALDLQAARRAGGRRVKGAPAVGADGGVDESAHVPIVPRGLPSPRQARDSTPAE